MEDAKRAVEGKFTVNYDSGCWEWDLSLCHRGYGRVMFRGKSRRAHRVMYIAVHGEDSVKDKLVLHHCDNRRCVNPTHLYAGTQHDNMNDMQRRNRHPRRKLTDADVAAIKADTRLQKAIAADYGASSSLVCMIKSGRIGPKGD